jgi:cytochrome c-type biogenesis protein CcmE
VKAKQKVTIGVVVVVAALAYLAVTGFSGNAGYRVSIGELLAGGNASGGDFLLTEGILQGDSVRWDGQRIELRFRLGDLQEQNKQIEVVYHGTRPDNFQDGTQVVVQGRYREGVFYAEKLTTKCPSKYEVYQPQGGAK